MDVVFDTSVTDFDRGGTSRYCRALLPRLVATGVAVREVSMTGAWPWTAGLPRAARLLLHDAAWVSAGASAVSRRLGADLYHAAGFKVPPRASLPTCVTIHDDTPWDDPPTARFYNRTYMRKDLELAAPRLAGAITSAAGTATLVLARLPSLGDRLHVTPWGVDHELFRPRHPAEVAGAMARVGIAAPYALVVSPYGPRKNQAAMLDALGRVHANHPRLRALVVGRHDPLTRDPLPVVRAGRVSDDDLAALYTGAAFLLYASLKEGFGMPVLEAMACGCPVVASAGTVLEEVTGSNAELVDPRSIEAIAAACEALLRDPIRRDRLARSGVSWAARFTWEETARLTAAAWGEMA